MQGIVNTYMHASIDLYILSSLQVTTELNNSDIVEKSASEPRILCIGTSKCVVQFCKLR